MLTIAGEKAPVWVGLRLDPDEHVVASLHGFLESGFALTERRLFGWRSTGTSLPLPLTAISRILVDTGTDGDHVDIAVFGRQAIHPPLILTRRGNEGVPTLAFVAEVARRCGREPHIATLGSVHRFSFD